MTLQAPASASAQPQRTSIAIDIGGTFTDVVTFDSQSGQIWNSKVSSTPSDQSIGFDDGVAEGLGVSGKTAADISQLLHGTTVATNLILEGKGAKCALLTTAGFRHVLEIARHDIPRKSNLYSWSRAARPVPPEQIFEVAGRITPDGSELEALDETAVRTAAQRLKSRGIVAVAICFLHAYANADHERRAREIFLSEHPDALLSISSDILPVFREYERTLVTILNSYVMPSVSTYVGRLESRMQERRIHAPLLLMKSSGGVTGTREIKIAPVQTALSGPAAGVVGAAFVGEASGFRDLITIDIGGTSADICLIKDGTPNTTTSTRIGEWPISLPMIDIHTIGAGGGSIASVSSLGGLTVGPRSAGAVPGPVCYMRGGTEPTVTDAHLVLGHLPPTCCKAASASTARRPRKPSARGWPNRWGWAWRRPPGASWRWSTTTWSAPSGWCPWNGVTTRATSSCCPSAAQGRCTAAPWPACWASSASWCPRRQGFFRRWA